MLVLESRFVMYQGSDYKPKFDFNVRVVTLPSDFAFMRMRRMQKKRLMPNRLKGT